MHTRENNATMKILCLLLILGALIGGSVILSDTILGYLRNQDLLARAHTELTAAKKQLDAAARVLQLLARTTQRSDRDVES
ncbi:hypothetical protein [Nannocystis sp. SCPEA4]|uniref:hypothetical protein n=1 Tax=Nannocystis sp. SCPEA4 TaxID=2996787 RepID=UPI00226DC0D3|nr:hypothetical protein [Nannocystis sp. SCPEA4]MCY1060048.1 hypothetical protein [Nannocystis sp. SCPEA4]